MFEVVRASLSKRFLLLGALATCCLGALAFLLLHFREQPEGQEGPELLELPNRTLGLPRSEGEPSRAELIAEADRKAILAERESSPERGARLLSQAAELRETSYLLEGRRVDVLEALELWSNSEERASEETCDAGLALIRLRAHLGSEPERTYRDLYIQRERQADPQCKKRIDRALALLAAYRPSEEELATLRQKLSDQSPPESGSGTVETKTGGHVDSHVVVPELKAALDRPTQITEVEPFAAEQTARVVVRVTHPTRFSVGLLEASASRSPRLFVDIQHATYEGPPAFEVGGLVKRVRLGKRKDATRVVLDLEQVVHHRVFYLPDPFRLVIDLSVQSPQKLAQPREIRRVVLDPGHGGSDPGAIGPNGLQEKDVTLDIAHRAAPLLAREVGVSTLLTRDVDVYVPLDERAARANAFHADLFVSIHLNSSEDPSTRGVMTFVLDAARDEAAAKVAARENASTEAAAAELANSLSRIESADRRAASELFARLLQRSAGASLRQVYPGIEDHGVRRAGFYVLAGASMPAVLFEGSFISNVIEAQRLDSKQYRQRLADSVVNAVRAYREGL